MILIVCSIIVFNIVILKRERRCFKIIGERVRHLWKKKNWSQEELADRTGFHRTYIGMVERGERNVSLKNIAKFAEAFCIFFIYLTFLLLHYVPV